MVDWTSGTSDASAAERATAFIPLRVPGSPDVFKEAATTDFLLRDASGDYLAPWAGGENPNFGIMFGGFNYLCGIQTSADDRQTAIISKSADSTGFISFKTGSAASERGRINSAGNWRIGTTGDLNFGARLGIQSAGNQTALELFDGGAANTTQIALSNASWIAGVASISGHLVFQSGGLVERARITEGGNFVLGGTSALATSRLTVVGSNNGAAIQCANSSIGIYISNLSGTAAYQPMSFCNAGNAFAQIGSITCSATTTAYNTSSDYRLKDGIEDLSGSGDFIDALLPRQWTWNQDGSPGAGFVAHEFAEVSPASVTGEKDAMQDREVVDPQTGETSIERVPSYQSMQASSPEVMAHIIAELQSLRARVFALESGQA